MASKSPLQKLQDAVVGTVKGAVADPVGTAGKAVQQARGTFAIGRMVAGQVTHKAVDLAAHRAGRTAPATPPPAARVVPAPRTEPVPAPRPPVAKTAPKPAPKTAEPKTAEPPVEVTPSDVARVVAKKSPAEKAAARAATAKKAPAKKASSPGAKLPPRKAPATTPAKKTAAKKSSPATASDTQPLVDPATTKAVASEASTGARAADPDKG